MKTLSHKIFKSIALLTVLSMLVLSLSGCLQGDKQITIASKPFAESYILAEMLIYLVERDTDIQVTYKEGIGGGTSNIHPALIKGEIDMYPEYTGTSWLFVLEKELIADPQALYEATKKAYGETYKLHVSGMYGFNNTFTMAVTDQVVQDFNLKSFSDLAAVSAQLSFGAEYDFFERDDGYPGLVDTYGFKFKDIKEMDIGLKYKAIGEDEVQVINAFSTDGLLGAYNLTVLEDDKNYFPAYHGITIVRQETIEKYPELLSVVEKLTGAISDSEMSALNLLVEGENQSPRDVARKFIDDKGL